VSVRLQAEDFDLGAEVARLTAGRDEVGAVVTFTGLCRRNSDGRPIRAMVLEHYPAMAQAELARIEAEARRRWPLDDVLVLHRYGRLEPGERIVLVVTLSAHREAAFAAAAFLMDYLKTRAPFWKREEFEDGAHWVEARAEDDAAAARWRTGADPGPAGGQRQDAAGRRARADEEASAGP
jgi:molybdopterin synthase catalytic subunit